MAELKARSGQTKMAMEAAEAPQRIAQMLDVNRQVCAKIAQRLNAGRPRLVMTCARGSSDHAATYLQYLSQIYLGIPATSLPPSIASIYHSDIDLTGVLFVVISQSGQSPDLIAGAEWAAKHGAYVVAMTNADNSPVAAVAHDVLPLHAGPELSVAATKSFLASLGAGAQLVGAVLDQPAFSKVLGALPDTLLEACALDWSGMVGPLTKSSSVFVVGRGQGLSAAAEIALKLKETSAIHAEAVSSAEIMHGPLGLLQQGMPVLIVGQNDDTLPGTRKLAAAIAEKGGHVLAAFEGASVADALPVVHGAHPAMAPIAAVQSFYAAASDLSRARGMEPDHPIHLKKVTETR